MCRWGEWRIVHGTYVEALGWPHLGILLLVKESSRVLEPTKASTVVGEACYLPATLHIHRRHTSLNISANQDQDDSMMAMLSAGIYDQDSIRIDMNPATYDFLLLQGVILVCICHPQKRLSILISIVLKYSTHIIMLEIFYLILHGPAKLKIHDHQKQTQIESTSLVRAWHSRTHHRWKSHRKKISRCPYW
jgi:hypothetical protein